MQISIKRLCALISVIIALCLYDLPMGFGAESALPTTTQAFDIPSQSLTTALIEFSAQTKLQVLYEGTITQGLQSPGVTGTLTPAEALKQLLTGTGLTYGVAEGGTITLQPVSGTAIEAPGGATPATDAAETTGQADARQKPIKVPEILVKDMKQRETAEIGNLPPDYAGGQVASGGRVGMLGNRNIMDTPFSQTNYTNRLILNQQARSVTDVLENSASVQRNGTRYAGFNAVAIRGLPFNGLDYAFDGLYGLYGRSNPIEGIERVELLRGANALLNGVPPAASVGGTINLVPKWAGEDPLARLTLGYFSDGQGSGHADVSRRFGRNKEFGIRINAAHRDGNTPINNQSERVTVGTLGVDYRGDRFRVFSTIGYDFLRVDGVTPSVIVGSNAFQIPGAPDVNKNLAQPWAFTQTERIAGTIRGEVDLTPNWTAGLAYGQASTNAKVLQTTVNLLDGNGNFNYASGRFFPQHVDGRTAEATLRGKLDTGPLRHKISLTGSGLWIEQGARVTPLPVTILSNLYNPIQVDQPGTFLNAKTAKSSETTLQGVAFSDTVSAFNDRVTLIAGARYQQIDISNFNILTGAKTITYRESKITPAVGLMVKPWKMVGFYANYIEGLQQGPTAPSTAVNFNQVFEPIVSRQIEAGVKLDWGNFGATVAAFQITRPSGLLDPTTLIFSANGEQRNRGLEFEAFGEPIMGYRLLTSLTLLDAELTKTPGGVNEGKRAPGSPNYYFTAAGEWDTPFFSGFTLTGQLRHSGPQLVNATNIQSIPSWTRFDVGGRYYFKLLDKDVMVRAQVLNVLGTHYWEQANTFGNELLIGVPRTVLITTGINF